MISKEILSYTPKILNQSQREHYFREGYLLLENIIPRKTIKNLISVTNKLIELSKKELKSGKVYDLAPGHSNNTPKVRRIKRPDEQHPVYWKFAKGLVADIASDLAGPNITFHHSKLNFKWPNKFQQDKVKWHQDIQFFPHTNYNVLTIGCYLNDTTMENGAMAVLPKSHLGKIFNQYDSNGEWAGCLQEKDTSKLNINNIRYLTGSMGSITVHNCKTLHFSHSSTTKEPRPLLLNCYASSDAKAYTPHPEASKNAYQLVRGKEVLWAHHDPQPCQIPPDWSKGYTSIYAAQTGEDKNS